MHLVSIAMYCKYTVDWLPQGTVEIVYTNFSLTSQVILLTGRPDMTSKVGDWWDTPATCEKDMWCLVSEVSCRVSRQRTPSYLLWFGNISTLPETNSSHLKMGGWKATFLMGNPIFRGELLVSGRVDDRYIHVICGSRTAWTRDSHPSCHHWRITLPP